MSGLDLNEKLESQQVEAVAPVQQRLQTKGPCCLYCIIVQNRYW